jgi:hypothetical protein
LEHKPALIIGVYVRVELAEGDRRGDHAERGDEHVVVSAKASKDEGNQLSILKRMTSFNEFVSEPLHLGEKFRRRHL